MRLIDIRDDALVLSGFVSGSRRRNISEFDVGDVEIDVRGMLLTPWREKTNQRGRNTRHVDVARVTGPYDPAAAMERWLAAYARVLGRDLRLDDPLFPQITRHGRIVMLKPEQAAERGGAHGYGPARHGGVVPARLSRAAVSEVTKTRAIKAGLGEGYSSQGLRRGMAQSAKAAGKPREWTAKRGGWARLESMDPYYDDEPFKDDVAGDLRLSDLPWPPQ